MPHYVHCRPGNTGHCGGPCEEDDNQEFQYYCLEKAQSGAGKGRKRAASTTPTKPGCKRQTTKKYTTRPSPPYPAQECKRRKMRGNDGNMWTSQPAVNGVYRWKPVKVNDAPKRTMQTRKRTDAAFKAKMQEVQFKMHEVRRLAIADGVRKGSGLPSLDQVRRLHAVGLAHLGEHGSKFYDDQLNGFYAVRRGNKLEWREAK